MHWGAAGTSESGRSRRLRALASGSADGQAEDRSRRRLSSLKSGTPRASSPRLPNSNRADTPSSTHRERILLGRPRSTCRRRTGSSSVFPTSRGCIPARGWSRSVRHHRRVVAPEPGPVGVRLRSGRSESVSVPRVVPRSGLDSASARAHCSDRERSGATCVSATESHPWPDPHLAGGYKKRRKAGQHGRLAVQQHLIGADPAACDEEETEEQHEGWNR
jgi:hypothetical protein